MSAAEYATIKTDVAAFLMARGHVLRDVRYNGAQCAFVFDVGAESDAETYPRNAPVPAQLFAEAWYKLRGIIKQTKASHGGGR